MLRGLKPADLVFREINVDLLLFIHQLFESLPERLRLSLLHSQADLLMAAFSSSIITLKNVSQSIVPP